MSTGKPTLDALKIHRPDLPAKEGGRWIWIVLLLLALAAGGYFWSKRSGQPVVQVAAARERSGENSGPRTLLNASGYVTARRAATVSSKVTGKVVEIKVEEGMKVEEGQLLAKLDDSNVAASYRLAQAQLESARRAVDEIRPNLAYARKQHARFTELASGNSVSKSDIERIEAEAGAQQGRLDRLMADIAVAEAEVAQWKQQVEDNVIIAPFAGIVTSKNAQPGEMISPMSVGGFTRTGICTIVDMSSLEIDVDVSESYINRVRPDQRVQATLDSYPDWKIPAKVIAIIPTADRQKATVKVRVAFEQLDPRILPDMAVKVAFQEAEPEAKAPAGNANAVTVPKSALYEDGGSNIVWVLRGDAVERRAVTVASTLDNESLLSSGLRNGEQVVISTSAKLSDGLRVKLSRP